MRRGMTLCSLLDRLERKQAIACHGKGNSLRRRRKARLPRSRFQPFQPHDTTSRRFFGNQFCHGRRNQQDDLVCQRAFFHHAGRLHRSANRKA